MVDAVAPAQGAVEAGPEIPLPPAAQSADGETGAPIPETVPAATTPQGIPFMVTNAMKAELRARGVSDEQIGNMTPQQAWETLNAPGPVSERSAPDDEEPGAPGRLDAAPEGTPEGAAARHPGGRPPDNNWAGAKAYVDCVVVRYRRRYGQPLPRKSNDEPNLTYVVRPMERFFKKEPPPRPKQEHIYRWLRNHPQEKQRWFGECQN